uniref:Uncharacterized protein n=1 Tax=Caenorhabditis japonica TaxID=281687 RepID=A0A8R1DVV3_CAEJA
MNRIFDNRREQLRAVEADLLSPAPMDPFQDFPKGWKRAAEMKENEWSRYPARPQSPPPREPSPVRRAVRVQRSPRVNPLRIPERRVLRQQNEQRAEDVPRRRALSPTQLPGVRAIPKDYNRFFRGLLAPGEYFAKSQTRYLGPYDSMPTEESLPEGDDYIILQRMGRLPDSGKSIFRQVGNLST